jgi:hypothetical protein
MEIIFINIKMNRLVLYPTFGQYFTSLLSGDRLVKGANSDSIRFYPEKSFRIESIENEVEVTIKNTEINSSEKFTLITGKFIERDDHSVLIEVKDDDEKISIPDRREKEKILCRFYKPLEIKYLEDIETVIFSGKQKAECSYFINPASASSYYILDLTENSLEWRVFAYSPFSYNGNVTMMVGNIQMISPQRSSAPRAMKAMAKPQIAQESLPVKADISSIEEYKSVDLGNRNLIEGKNLIILEVYKSLKLNKFYLARLANGTNEVNYGYTFNAPKFLANAIVRLDKDKLTLGESIIPETQASKEVKIYISSTSRVIVKTNIISSKDSAKVFNKDEETETEEKGENISIGSSIENLTDTNILLYLEYYVGSNIVSKMKKGINVKRENGNLIFTLNLAPGKHVFENNFYLQY